MFHDGSESYGEGAKNHPRVVAAVELVALVAATCILFLLAMLIALGWVARLLP